MPKSDLLSHLLSENKPARRKLYIISALGALTIALAGCSSSDDADLNAQTEKPVDALYNDALNTALAGDVDVAAPKFEEVERQHPYSIWAVRAQIMAAWSFYQSNQYTQAEASLDRFIELYPADPLTEYAYYLKALSYYEQIVDVERDADMTYKALNAFEDLLRRYPDGAYARDAQLKADLARSHLAGKEMEVGRYYLRRKHYTASINRFRVVVEDFQTTTHTAEALHRLVEAYLSLGLTDEAQTAGAILGHNYQSTEWYEASYKLLTGQGLEMKSFGDNWLTAIYRQTIKGEWI